MPQQMEQMGVVPHSVHTAQVVVEYVVHTLTIMDYVMVEQLQVATSTSEVEMVA